MSESIKLSPSEVVLLHGDSLFSAGELTLIGNQKKHFVTRDGEKGISRKRLTKILGADVLVPEVTLSRLVILAALIACEEAQLIRMDVKKDDWLPSRNTLVLTEVKVYSKSFYPESTIEGHIVRLVKLPPEPIRTHQLTSIIWDLFSDKFPTFGGVGYPHMFILEMVKDGLAKRGLLGCYEYSGVNFLTGLISKFRNPVNVWTSKEQVEKLRSAAKNEIGAVNDMLTNYRKQKPELWDQLNSKIAFGINSSKFSRPYSTGY